MLRGLHRAGVLGSPIAHSLSPVLHSAAYDALGLHDWRYSRHEVDVATFATFMQGLDDSWRGLSLTMPLKEVAFEVAATVSGTARDTGAVNTLLRRDGGWAADNTDVDGVLGALAEAGVSEVPTASVIGSGATARSVVAGLARLGLESVHFTVRTRVRPQTAQMVARLGLRMSASEGVVPATLLASTTPAGVPGPPVDVAAYAVVFDVAYGSDSALVDAATRAGVGTVQGVDLLLHQAARQVTLMTGRPAPVEAMRSALSAARAAAVARDPGVAAPPASPAG